MLSMKKFCRMIWNKIRQTLWIASGADSWNPSLLECRHFCQSSADWEGAWSEMKEQPLFIVRLPHRRAHNHRGGLHESPGPSLLETSEKEACQHYRQTMAEVNGIKWRMKNPRHIQNWKKQVITQNRYLERHSGGKGKLVLPDNGNKKQGAFLKRSKKSRQDQSPCYASIRYRSRKVGTDDSYRYLSFECKMSVFPCLKDKSWVCWIFFSTLSIHTGSKWWR